MEKVEKKKDYGKYILENKEHILKKKKKIRSIKRSLSALVILFSILVTLCFNLDFFNIAEIEVTGNSNVTSDEVIKLSEVNKGDNIFKFKISDVKNNILINPYILDLKIERKFPNKIKLQVAERKATFYVSYNESFYVIDSDSIVLEKRDSIEGMKLIKLSNIDLSTAEIGKPIFADNEEQKRVIFDLCDIFYTDNINGEHMVSDVELNDFVDINIHVDNVKLKLGTSKNIKEKLAKAYSILNDQHFLGMKGYIDVSFSGNPVIYKEE
jgi:cell division protein FtsQ